jgi:DNA-binding response OmpR family regulator
MSKNRRVLAVDDEPGILSFITKSLSLAGYEVIATDRGEDALQLVRSKNPDVVLLDVLMGPVSGFEITEEIRSFSQVPIIVFTARSRVSEIAIEAGATACISKPFKPQEIIEKIEEVLGD